MMEAYQQPMGDPMMDPGMAYPLPNNMNEMPSQMSDGLLQYQLDNDEMIENLEHILRQEEASLDPQGNMVWKPKLLPDGSTLKPLCSEEFINHIRLLLKSRLNKVFILSDLDEPQIIRFTQSVASDVIKKIVLDWFGCGIKDTSTASMIVHMIDESVYATMCKAKDANYLVFLKTVAKLQETMVTGAGQRPQKKEMDMMDPMGFFKKGRR